MKFIGITGGVGAGKSAILEYLSSKPKIRVMLADEIAHILMSPGTVCYDRIVDEFCDVDILSGDGSFDKEKLASLIFSNDINRERLNAIVHPAVKEYVIEQYAIETKKKELDYLVLEAALLIEEHYDEICDELWYIYTSRENRRIRLKATRGYSDAKIDSIFDSQLSDEEYKRACKISIDNNGSLKDTYEQIDSALGI